MAHVLLLPAHCQPANSAFSQFCGTLTPCLAFSLIVCCSMQESQPCAGRIFVHGGNHVMWFLL